MTTRSISQECENLQAFIEGFAHKTKLTKSDGFDQWSGFSRELSDAERQEVEQAGFQSGVDEGQKFNEMRYPGAIVL